MFARLQINVFSLYWTTYDLLSCKEKREKWHSATIKTIYTRNAQWRRPTRDSCLSVASYWLSTMKIVRLVDWMGFARPISKCRACASHCTRTILSGWSSCAKNQALMHTLRLRRVRLYRLTVRGLFMLCVFSPFCYVWGSSIQYAAYCFIDKSNDVL